MGGIRHGKSNKSGGLRAIFTVALYSTAKPVNYEHIKKTLTAINYPKLKLVQ